jgi:hypothetical protein
MNNLQNTKNGGKHRGSGRGCSSCSTSGTRRVAHGPHLDAKLVFPGGKNKYGTPFPLLYNYSDSFNDLNVHTTSFSMI